jgi:hypothetical protein
VGSAGIEGENVGDMPSSLTPCGEDSACGQSLHEGLASLHRNVTSALDNHALANWIQL